MLLCRHTRACACHIAQFQSKVQVDRPAKGAKKNVAACLLSYWWNVVVCVAIILDEMLLYVLLSYLMKYCMCYHRLFTNLLRVNTTTCRRYGETRLALSFFFNGKIDYATFIQWENITMRHHANTVNLVNVLAHAQVRSGRTDWECTCAFFLGLIVSLRGFWLHLRQNDEGSGRHPRDPG